MVVFLSHADSSFEKNDVDTTVPLSLAMFQETVPPEPAPEAAPVTRQETPPEAMPEKAAPYIKTEVHPPEKKSRPVPVVPMESVIEPAVHPEPDINLDRSTVAETLPATAPVNEEDTVQKTHLGSQYESLKQRYIKTLLKRIHRKKHYPRRARRSGEEGEVLVSFMIGQTGDISLIRVSRSSGYENLDQAAVKTIARVSPLQPLPDELGMASWELAVPIAFDLRK